MIKKTTPMAILTCLLLVTGCSDVQDRAIKNVDSQIQSAENGLEKIRDNLDDDSISSVKFSDRIWLGSRGYRQQNGDPLPNKYDHLTYMTAEAQTLREIVVELSEMTGMRFMLNEDNQLSPDDADENIDAAMLDLGSISEDFGLNSSSNIIGGTVALRYSGDFVGLLNQLATKFDIFWEHRDNVIYLSKYVTRTFALYALPSSTELTSTISSESDSSISSDDGSSQSNSQSGTENEIVLETSLNVWEEIEVVIESMVPEGSTYAMSPSTGTLTVTTTPMAIEKVENLIKKQNEIISRQVIIDVNVMTIVTSESDSFQVDFQALLQNVSDNFNLDWSGPSGNLTQTTGLGSFAPSYISDSGENTVDLILEALSEKFERSIVTNSTVTTLNNQSVPLQIITRESYLKSLTTTITSETTSTTAEPGDITTGFVMNVLPRILANGEIIMQYSMSLSEKLSLETINFGEDGQDLIQLPTIVSRDFLQNIKLKSGNTLILAGYDRLVNISEKSGTGNPDNYFFGGGKNGSIAKEVLVIMVTPRII